MHEPTAPTHLQTAIALARLAAAADALSSVIAGFALLAGARAFMFIALLGWREPVLGGAGLVLLAMIGWLRWRCGGIASVHATPADCPTMIRTGGSCGGAVVAAGRVQLSCADTCNVACYNRPSQCNECKAEYETAARGSAGVEPRSCGAHRT